ncbi:MAG TPA: tRNA 4-thiouridine(8) synthase ThiI [Firmicutes bacterium]|nr:tRNA 4-thiouridine(8) synthase ThiI [Candidatus Fermentithermobacillaceae bacterium]
MERVILIRYGEIALKGENRRDFEFALKRNIQQSLEGLEGITVRRAHGRFFVEGPGLAGNAETDALDRLSRIPGVVSISPSRLVPNDVDQIAEAGKEIIGEFIRENRRQVRLGVSGGPERENTRPITFKVTSKRAWKGFPLSSPELDAKIGAFLLRTYPELMVDVHHPSVTLGIEVREDGTYLYSKEIPGPGGLPAGTAGKGVLLLSGGIDSPVAGYLAARRGIRVLALHFWSYPITSQRSRDKVVDLVKILRRYDSSTRLYVAHFTQIQTRIMEKCPEKLRVVVMRRMMMRVAEAFALKEGALCIVTGENVGQVASQTLESLRAIEEVTTLPVIRPLACFDKRETVELARKIGTYETSCLPYEDCCTVFVPRHPATKPGLEESRAAERALEIEEMVAKCVENIEEIRLS